MSQLIFSLALLAGLNHAATIAPPSTTDRRLQDRQMDTRPLLGNQIHYELSGRDKPQTLVMIHGLNSYHGTFRSVLGRLAREFNVLTYDQRGAGRTEHRSTNFSPEIMARDLQSLLDHLHLDRVSVLGHSMGGRTAMAFAGMFPERTNALIVEDMEVQPRTQQSIDEYLDLGHRAAGLPMIYPSKANAVEALQPFFREQADRIVGRGEAVVGGFRLRQHPQAWFFTRIQGNHADVRPLLHNYPGPILFLKAERDSIIGARGWELISREFPNALRVEIKGAGHSIHKTRPKRFCREILEFLRPWESSGEISGRGPLQNAGS